MMTRPNEWHHLSPRMLLVHPIHEMLRQLPVLVGSVVLGSATGNASWPLVALGVTVVFGLLRWFFTTYRIDDENVSLRTGVMARRQISIPRSRIRSVETEARLLHRLVGLTVLRVGTGQQAGGEAAFVLDAVESALVPQLRASLLAESLADTPGGEAAEPSGQVLARWQPSWLRYAPLSFSGLVMIGAVIGVGYQTGLALGLPESGFATSTVDAIQRTGVVLVLTVALAVVVAIAAPLAVLFSWLTYGNLLLRRDTGRQHGVLHLRYGLLRIRERTFDMSRLRGATLREPLLVRALRGARLDAVMTGVHGDGESAVLLPPCPSETAVAVLVDLIGNQDAAAGPLRTHGPAATRRRWTRVLLLPAIAGFGLIATASTVGVPAWTPTAWAVLTACCAGIAADRARSLGHRVADGWLVARAGSLERRRDCIACDGVIGWTVRQTLFQRRAGVATLVAATAAGRKSYQVIDVPTEAAWSVAGAASPWVADSMWARHDDAGAP
ncbi:PH domain-containing protein [Mycobacterium spongiae]|uniref:PH domain-containing protein n=1 Tax=Mycobacterium spongiae TaxID=886343 RepID=A0A975JZE4_9MYCO|nr:PH domain-containing protein [Mycobacterium spongiae]QUR68529.1 PH domain-containing protein [Mycobacterium spongiae]